MSQSQTEEKALPPSARKLREARKKGQIARSREIVAAVVTSSGFLYLLIRAPGIAAQLQAALLAATRDDAQPFDRVVGPLSLHLAQVVVWSAVPLAATLVASAVLSNLVVNGGVLAAIDPVLPKVERLDPVEGFRRLFALRNLIETLKSLLKVLVVGSLSAALIAASVQALVEQPECGLICAAPTLGGLLRPLLGACCGFFLALGLLDIGLQRWLFQRDMRMTKSEMKRERKEMEGDPLIKRQHRREQRAAAHAVFRAGLRNATFVLRGPDLALAMRFAPPDALVPVLVARGAGEGAPLLGEEARVAGVPVVFDAETSAALGKLKVGQIIGKEMFQPVIACMREAGVL